MILDLTALVLAFTQSNSEAVNRRYDFLRGPPEPAYTITFINATVPRLPDRSPVIVGGTFVLTFKF